jgi:ankyrin repeat protein
MDEDVDGTPEHREQVSFLRAARMGDYDRVQQLMGKVPVDCQDQWGSTALMNSAYMMHMDIVKLLIENEADINKQDSKGITALMEASWNRHLPVVELLVKGKASLNATDERKYTALMQAGEEGHSDVVKYLVS